MAPDWVLGGRESSVVGYGLRRRKLDVSIYAGMEAATLGWLQVGTERMEYGGSRLRS